MEYNNYGKLLLPSNLEYEVYRKSCSIVNIENTSDTLKLVINLKVLNAETIEQVIAGTTIIDSLPFVYEDDILIDSLETINGIYSADFTISEDILTIFYINREKAYSKFHFVTVFNVCKLLECRINLLNRVLGELDNCKEECDCVALYDFNAFNILYESIVAIISGCYMSWFNMNTIVNIETVQLLTNLNELLKQSEKYCIECVKPCKDC